MDAALSLFSSWSGYTISPLQSSHFSELFEPIALEMREKMHNTTDEQFPHFFLQKKEGQLKCTVYFVSQNQPRWGKKGQEWNTNLPLQGLTHRNKEIVPQAARGPKHYSESPFRGLYRPQTRSICHREVGHMDRVLLQCFKLFVLMCYGWLRLFQGQPEVTELKTG